ncbi:LOW QUALITY PROTEIN: hypothetical protein PHMEG_00015016, partial [Phytophthora megakarya]
FQALRHIDRLRNFQIQYCGLRVLLARQYYHAHRRFDESPLDYLYWLNVAGLRGRLKIKDGNAEDLREVLRARDRAKSRQNKAALRSGKFRQKASNAAPSAPAKQVRAIQIQAVDSGSDTSDGSDGSDSEMGSHRRIYLAANQEVAPKEESEMIMPESGHQDLGSMNISNRSIDPRSRVTVSTMLALRIQEALKSRMLETPDLYKVRQARSSGRSLPFCVAGSMT